MAAPHGEPSVTRRVRSYRQRMRAQGMRPIQMWMADVRVPPASRKKHTVNRQQSPAASTRPTIRAPSMP